MNKKAKSKIEYIINECDFAYKKAEKTIININYLSNKKSRKVFIDTFMEYITNSAMNFFKSDINKLDIFQKTSLVKGYSGFSWIEIYQIVENKKENTTYNDFLDLQKPHFL